MTMRKTGRFDKDDQVSGEALQSEYRFDYKKAKPNRFAGKLDENQVVVILGPDIARVFKSSENVNAVLRALIETMPREPVTENGR